MNFHHKIFEIGLLLPKNLSGMFFPAQTLYMKSFFYSALMVSSLVYFWNAKIWIDIIYYYTYILLFKRFFGISMNFFHNILHLSKEVLHKKLVWDFCNWQVCRYIAKNILKGPVIFRSYAILPSTSYASDCLAT